MDTEDDQSVLTPVVEVLSFQRNVANQKLNTLRVQIKLLIAYLQTDTHSAGVKLAQTEKRLRELVENLTGEQSGNQ